METLFLILSETIFIFSGEVWLQGALSFAGFWSDKAVPDGRRYKTAVPTCADSRTCCSSDRSHRQETGGARHISACWDVRRSAGPSAWFSEIRFGRRFPVRHRCRNV